MSEHQCLVPQPETSLGAAGGGPALPNTSLGS